MSPSDLAKLQAKFPISQSCLRRNQQQWEDECARTIFKGAAGNQAGGEASGTIAKPTLCDESVAAAKRKAVDATGLHVRIVRITSYRRRLLDPDNLAGGVKYFLDCCKYCGLISDDAPDEITLEVRQEQVKSKTAERTEIEIR